MHSARPFTTLGQFIIDRENDHLNTRGQFSQLLRDIVLACKFIHREVNRAGLTGILSAHGSENIHGEEVQKLDIFSNNHLKRSLKNGGVSAVIASEEEDDHIILNDQSGEYVVLFDPLDGSSNIDVNISVGTIFSIYRRVSSHGHASVEDCLRKGHFQVCAGYVLYGSSTILTFTTGKGVHIFTFDPGLGDFFLCQSEVKIPETTRYISVNDMNFNDFLPGVKNYLESIRGSNSIEQDFKEKKINLNSVQRTLTPRYVGSLVADFHRNLLKGGVFLYPGTISKPEGKLRLLYEANPMAFIVEQAGGIATDGKERILDIQPKKLHQRTPLIIGNKTEVEYFLSLQK